jgi:hypothetical protein
MSERKFNKGDDVTVTQLWYWGRKTLIWRGRYVDYLPEDDAFIIHTDEGEMSFVNATVRSAVEDDVYAERTKSLTD